MRVSIATKLIAAILAINVPGIAFLATFIYIRSSAGQSASAIENATNLAGRHAMEVKAMLEVPMDAARTLAQTMELFRNLDPAERRRDYNNTLRGILAANPEFLGVWSCWEPDALDGMDAQYAGTPGSDSSGRFIPYWNRGTGSITLEPLVGYDKSGEGDYYQVPCAQVGNRSSIPISIRFPARRC